MCISVYIYIHVHTAREMFIDTHIDKHTHTHVHIYHPRANIHVCTCTGTRKCVRTRFLLTTAAALTPVIWKPAQKARDTQPSAGRQPQANAIFAVCDDRAGSSVLAFSGVARDLDLWEYRGPTEAMYSFVDKLLTASFRMDLGRSCRMESNYLLVRHLRFTTLDEWVVWRRVASRLPYHFHN